MSDQFTAWVRDVYEPAVKVISGAFQEATGACQDDGRHFATAVLARLMRQDPPITVTAFEDAFEVASAGEPLGGA